MGNEVNICKSSMMVVSSALSKHQGSPWYRHWADSAALTVNCKIQAAAVTCMDTLDDHVSLRSHILLEIGATLDI